MKRQQIASSMVVLVLFLGTLSLTPSAPSQAPTNIRLIVMGDMGVTADARANVQAGLAEGGKGLIGLGDYEYWQSYADWRALVAPLVNQSAYMVFGNHDNFSRMGEFFPDGRNWSRNVSGVRLVGINTETSMGLGSSQYNFAREALCNATEPVRILLMHRAWWVGAKALHPGAEFPGNASSMDQLVVDCGVDLVFAGHEHYYTRSIRNGVPYVIVGTGGQEIRPVVDGSPGTVRAIGRTYGRVLLDLDPTGYTAQFVNLEGAVLDTFAHVDGEPLPPPMPLPDLTFEASGGTEWWSSVRINGTDAPNVSTVWSREAGGAWHPLSLRASGAWAASIRIVPNNTVEHRAVLNDGRTLVSCAYAHPTGECYVPPPPPPPPSNETENLTFARSTGNEWWVQIALEGPGAPNVTRVESRDTGGPWVDLTYRSWGAWAGSYQVEPGNLVRYRATLADNRTIESCDYAHPTSACYGENQSTFIVSFVKVRGNRWWVETDVSVSGPALATVDARVNNSTWTPLAKQTYGSWAKAISVPVGANVTLRATGVEGSIVESGAYAWPPG